MGAYGTTKAKLKGSACIGDLKNYKNINELQPLDKMDIVESPNEQDAFFITTSRRITTNQTRRVCNGNNKVPKCAANDASACKEELYSPNSQGLFTGECGDNDRCQMYSWCPLENDKEFDIINNIGEFTVFVKIDISFEQFGLHRENEYDIKGNGRPVFGYNLWTINDILSNATNGKVTSYKQIAKTGAVIVISSVWDCNCDEPESECSPEYEMRRIDDVPNIISSVGYHVVNVAYNPTQQYRVLRELFGIRVIFTVEGRAGKFHWVALLTTFGAGMAYLGIAVWVCDQIMENCLPDSEFYTKNRARDIPADILSSHSIKI